jgi:hypothetical protein
MQAPEHDLPVTMTQVIVWLRQCSTQEKKVLLKALLDDSAALTIASEPSLSTDWSSEEEDEAWKDL